MFIKATDLGQSTEPEFDLCIVGAGAAGISIAQRLVGSGLRVALLESGAGLAGKDEDADDLNKGVSSLADYPFQTSRTRGFGGTTALWTGACVPLSADDFEARDWVPHSGWPITSEELDPYYKAAAPLFGLVDPEPFLPDVEGSPLHGAGLEAWFAQITRIPHFGKNHRAHLERAENVTCISGATVTGLRTTSDGRRVVAVDVRDPQSDLHSIEARNFVLATGGLEAPRQLLLAPPEMQAAMGRSFEAVGRYHMEHPIRSLGVIKVPDGQRRVTAFTDLTATTGADLQGVFGLSEEVRRREKLLNLHFRAYRFNALEDDPVIVRLKSVASEGRAIGAADVFNPASLVKLLRYGSWHLWNKKQRSARFDHIRLLAFLEQEPDADNRITLSDTKDRFGMPLPHLQLTESHQMQQSVARSLEVMSDALRQNGLPDHRLGEDDHLTHYGGYGLHHMGGTRMSADPARGVVDSTCRVHGLNNLFVASSSVFSTGGAANPTLTISALALRLADYLKSDLLSP